MLTREWVRKPQETEPTEEAARSFRGVGCILVDFSKVPKTTTDSNTSKQGQEEDHSSEYSLKTFPKRDRRNPVSLTETGPANFIIELIPHSDSTPSNRDLSSEALVRPISRSSPVDGCAQVHWIRQAIVFPSRLFRLPPILWHRPVVINTIRSSREPSKIEEYASRWFAHSSSLHYGEDHLLHVDSRHLFLPSSIRIPHGLL